MEHYIEISETVLRETQTTFEEIKKLYKQALNKGESSRGFIVNGHLLGIDRSRSRDLIFYCHPHTTV